MTGVTAFADIDVATCDFERSVDPHVRRILDGLMDREQRNNLDRTADAGYADDREQKADRLALKPVMQVEHAVTPPVEAR